MKVLHPIVMTCALVMGSACNRADGDSRCYTVCDRANECGVDKRPVDVECDHFCPDVEQMQARMEGAGVGSCSAEYDAHLSCWMENLGEICAGSIPCAESGAAWTECMTSFCAANAEAVEAFEPGASPDPNCFDDGTPALAPF